MGGTIRYAVYIGLFLMMTINYVDRINLSVAAGSIAATYQLSPIELGYLFSAYSWTYALFLVPIGIAIDRWGTRRMVAGAMTVWSIGGMLTGFVTSFPALVGARLVLGAGESAGFPAGARVIREWAPRTERGFATGILNAGAYLGPALGAIFVGWLISFWGWRASFYITGAIGIVFGIIWYALYRTPENASWVGAAEKSKILAERDHTEGKHERLSAGKTLQILVTSRTMWALVLTQGCAGYTLYLFASWLPRYFEVTRGADILKTSGLTAVPYLVAGILLLVISRLSDRYLGNAAASRGERRNVIAGNLLLASIVVVVPYVSSLAAILVIFSISLTCVASALSLNVALTNDLLKRGEASATAVGFLVTGANVFGIVSPIATGYLVAATGNFGAAFTIAGVLLALGAVISFALTRRGIDEAFDRASAMQARVVAP